MLTFQDFADYCDLSDDEIQSILNGADITPLETCVIVQGNKDCQKENQLMEEFLQDYLEKLERPSDMKRSH